MPGYVFNLDASAILKRYRTETGTEVVDALFESQRLRQSGDVIDARRDSVSGRKLVTSHFTCLEVESVAARMLKGRDSFDRAYSTLLGSFARDLHDFISLQPFDGQLLNYAIEMTRRTRLRPADSIQLPATLNATEEGRELILVSSDKELLAAASGAGIKTLNPEDAGASEALNEMM